MKAVSSFLCLVLLTATAGSVPPSAIYPKAVKTEAAVLPAPFNVQTIRCESNWGQRKYCRVNTNGGVKLSYQYSDAGCWENDTWGYDSNGVWVSNGCRADFEVGKSGLSGGEKAAIGIGLGALAAGIIGAVVANRDNDNNNDNYYGNNPDPYYGDVVKCNSNDEKYHTCETGRNRGVEMTRQISGSPCRYNSTWGYNRNQIWVDRGCRAEFRVYR